MGLRGTGIAPVSGVCIPKAKSKIIALATQSFLCFGIKYYWFYGFRPCGTNETEHHSYQNEHCKSFTPHPILLSMIHFSQRFFIASYYQFCAAMSTFWGG
jgi:hypothetical protein